MLLLLNKELFSFANYVTWEFSSLLNIQTTTRHSSTYISWDQEGSAQVLVKREAPSFSVAIHAGNVLLHRLIVEPEPYAIIVVDLLTEKQRGDHTHTYTSEVRDICSLG